MTDMTEIMPLRINILLSSPSQSFEWLDFHKSIRLRSQLFFYHVLTALGVCQWLQSSGAQGPWRPPHITELLMKKPGSSLPPGWSLGRVHIKLRFLNGANHKNHLPKWQTKIYQDICLCHDWQRKRVLMKENVSNQGPLNSILGWMRSENCLPGSPKFRCFVYARTHVDAHTHTHALDFQMPQVIYITVNYSDELHVLSLLQALCFHVHMALGVKLIPAAVLMLEMPRVKQRWLGPVEVLNLVMLHQAADLVICSVTANAWNCFIETDPKSMSSTYSFCSAGKLEAVVVSGELGLLMRNTKKLYNSHKIFNQIVSTVVWEQFHNNISLPGDPLLGSEENMKQVLFPFIRHWDGFEIRVISEADRWTSCRGVWQETGTISSIPTPYFLILTSPWSSVFFNVRAPGEDLFMDIHQAANKPSCYL